MKKAPKKYPMDGPSREAQQRMMNMNPVNRAWLRDYMKNANHITREETKTVPYC